jgi:hypothetical protein
MRALKIAGKVLLHLFWLWPIIFLSSALAGELSRIPGIYWGQKQALFGLMTPPYPIHILCATLTGFVVGRRFKHAEARWIFILPTVWFLLRFVAEIRMEQSVLAGTGWYFPTDLFFNRDPMNAEMRGQIYPYLYTLPFLTGVGYSLGAWIARWMKLPEQVDQRLNSAVPGAQLEP